MGPPEGFPDDSFLGDDGRDVLRRGDVEGGIQGLHPGRCQPAPPRVRDLGRVALFDRDFVAALEVEVDGAHRGGHVKGQVVRPGREGHLIGADLVGHIAVGSYPVGADNDLLHYSAAEQGARGGVGWR